MVVMGYEQIGMLSEDGAAVAGVLLLEDIFREISTEVDRCAPKPKYRQNEAHMQFLKIGRQTTCDDEMPTPHALALSKGKKKIRKWLDSKLTQSYILSLVIVDFVCFLYAIANPNRSGAIGDNPLDDPLNTLTGSILYAFFFETVLRVFAYQDELLFYPIEVFDVCVVFVSILTFLCWTIAGPMKSSIAAGLITCVRLMRFVHFVCVVPRLRKMVGGGRSRYQMNGFDLDLT